MAIHEVDGALGNKECSGGGARGQTKGSAGVIGSYGFSAIEIQGAIGQDVDRGGIINPLVGSQIHSGSAGDGEIDDVRQKTIQVEDATIDVDVTTRGISVQGHGGSAIAVKRAGAKVGPYFRGGTVGEVVGFGEDEAAPVES